MKTKAMATLLLANKETFKSKDGYPCTVALAEDKIYFQTSKTFPINKHGRRASLWSRRGNNGRECYIGKFKGAVWISETGIFDYLKFCKATLEDHQRIQDILYQARMFYEKFIKPDVTRTSVEEQAPEVKTIAPLSHDNDIDIAVLREENTYLRSRLEAYAKLEETRKVETELTQRLAEVRASCAKLEALAIGKGGVHE